MIPTDRPTHAPIAREGRKIPAGRDAPNVAAVRRVFAKAVTRRRVTTVYDCEVLRNSQSRAVEKEGRYALADPVGVYCTAILKELRHELTRRDSHEDDLKTIFSILCQHGIGRDEQGS